MRKTLQPSDILKPGNIVSNLITDYIHGALDDTRVLFRASVVAIDNVGGQFEQNPDNPKGSVKARIFTNRFNAYTSDDDLPVFWPLFSHDLMPIKEKEHVYVLFEDEKREHGLWFGRLPQPNTCENKNFVAGVQQYRDYDSSLTAADAERQVQDLVFAPTEVNVSDEMVLETGVPFVARVGDRVIHGSNNSMIVLGRDRPGNRTTGQHDNAGTVDVVVGRVTTDDMDMANDKARVYVSANTEPDANAGTTNVGQAAQASSAVIAIGDQVRIVARAGTKIVVTGGDLTLEATNVNIGNNATEHSVLGDQLATFLSDVLDKLIRAVLATPAGPGAFAPDTIAALTALKTRIVAAQSNPFLSQTVKVKQ